MATALITGASSGIGKELAYIHAEKGGDMVLVARSVEQLKSLKKVLESTHGVKVHVIIKDLTNPRAAEEIYAETSKKDLQIDYLINNAGFGLLGRFHEVELRSYLNMIQLNITALTALSHYYSRDMVLRRSGRILNVSSTASLLPGPLQAVYFATKAYVTSLSNALYEELKDYNISVTNLMPGATETGFGARSGMDKTSMFKKTASARSVAEDGYKAMMEGKIDVISGLPFSGRLMMAMVPFAPKKMLLKSVKEMQKEV
jgi:short-subunit dehydrogenase